MANWSVTNTFSNSTTADATQVNTNFTDLINCSSDGTKSMSIAALTCAGALTINAAATLGSSTSNDIIITGSLAATINIKTTFSYDIGSATIGLRSIYLGDSGSAARTTKIIGAVVASSWTLTLPVSPGTAGYLLQTDGSGVSSWIKDITGTTTNDNAAAGKVGEYIESLQSSATSFPTTGQYGDLGSLSLTAGDWDVSLLMQANNNGSTMVNMYAGIGTATGNSSTGLTAGINLAAAVTPTTTTTNSFVSIPPYRVSLSGTTTIYGKVRADYSVATPQYVGRISARRVR